jgi:hypothetical protein
MRNNYVLTLTIMTELLVDFQATDTQCQLTTSAGTFQGRVVGTSKRGPTIRDGLLAALRGERHLVILAKSEATMQCQDIDVFFGQQCDAFQGTLFETHLGPLYILS